jgi:hypothetical protein
MAGLRRPTLYPAELPAHSRYKTLNDSLSHPYFTLLKNNLTEWDGYEIASNRFKRKKRV